MLTNEEIRKLQAQHPTENDPMLFARAVEAALLAKLAAAEMPKYVASVTDYPLMGVKFTSASNYGCGLKAGEKLYTEAQLQQAHAQGYAKALSAEPSAIVSWQVGGLVVRIVGNAREGDLLYTRSTT